MASDRRRRKPRPHAFVIRRFIGPLPRPAPRTKTTAEMLENAGIGPIEGSPISDPLFMETSKFDERQSIRAQLAAWRDQCGVSSGAHDYIKLADGSEVLSHIFYEQQNRLAYAMLLRNIDHRTIAAATHLEPSDVATIAEQYHLQ